MRNNRPNPKPRRHESRVRYAARFDDAVRRRHGLDKGYGAAGVATVHKGASNRDRIEQALMHQCLDADDCDMSDSAWEDMCAEALAAAGVKGYGKR